MNFKYCPQCGGVQSAVVPDENCFKCHACDFLLYQNVAATASMILVCQGEFLFSVRGRDPSEGLLDFPGGFVDPGESLEEAFVREMNEELGWCPESFQYAFSFPNTYIYQSIKYSTSDVFYFVEMSEKPEITAQDDVAELRWLALAGVDDADLAFDSMKLAITQLKEIFGVA